MDGGMTSTTRTRLIYTSAITSTLLLILYLPVLIWSPPWGVEGYYFPDMQYDYVIIQNAKISHRDIDTLREFSNYAIIKNDEHWVYELWPSEIAIIGNKYPGTGYSYFKAFNPLKIWHIKYLEWIME